MANTGSEFKAEGRLTDHSVEKLPVHKTYVAEQLRRQNLHGQTSAPVEWLSRRNLWSRQTYTSVEWLSGQNLHGGQTHVLIEWTKLTKQTDFHFSWVAEQAKLMLQLRGWVEIQSDHEQDQGWCNCPWRPWQVQASHMEGLQSRISGNFQVEVLANCQQCRDVLFISTVDTYSTCVNARPPENQWHHH